jgi:hypothetical protein
MPSSRYLGNDVVALNSPRSQGKVADRRFMERVFAGKEREAILSSPDPEFALWLHWAGKEALFKTVTKASGSPPIFHHPSFRVSYGEEATSLLLSGDPVQGVGSYGDLVVQLEGELFGHGLHVLSWLPLPQDATEETAPIHRQVAQLPEVEADWRESLRDRFSEAEVACASHRASALTRLGARASLASILKVEEGRLEIRCGAGKPGRRVPLVYLDGKTGPVDLTLSHDAHLGAWSFGVLT